MKIILAQNPNWIVDFTIDQNFSNDTFLRIFATVFESLKTDKLEDQKQALESGTTQLWNRQMQLNYA